MNEIAQKNKPKLVFFQYIHEDRAKFVLLHKQQHVQCLSEFFDVIVIHEDCDYQQICDKYQPDITLFESGFAVAKSRIIKNTHVYPEIPKLGFYNGDSWCGSRSSFISDMEHWGITTFFTMSAPLAEYMPPEFSKNLFTWLNCIDPELYKDYRESKIIPVYLPGSFTGTETLLYSWRQKVYKIISENYPSLISPHLGYEARKASRMIYGEQYARILNASWFVPTCGAMAKEIVRKHFEIPACKSCLITEKTPALEAAGFVDMQNCVFADENDVLDKLDYLFQNPEELKKITNAGYQLVHSHHTLKQRDQIFQWFNLNKILKPGQKIVQKSIFGSLIITEESSGIQNSHIIGNGLDRILLRQGDEKLLAGKYDEAEALYLQCLKYSPVMPEPKLRLAICKLYQGDVTAALEWVTQPIQWNLVFGRALDPDPVDWAYFIISLLCQGKLNEAIKRSNQFPSLSHPELNRTRWVINVLENPGQQITIPNSDSSNCRLSVQQLPNRSFNNWLDNVCIMLEFCKQIDFAESLKKAINSEFEVLKTIETRSDSVTAFLKKPVEKIYKSFSKKLSNIFENILNHHPQIKVKIYNLSITPEPFYITLITRIRSKFKKNSAQTLK
ncbi:glycosyltransferase [Pelatocladus sp. BLCC-F211]|uniref:glycosyltransferase family protein n=1 Tax=Pelatocladus sp. BLCC-F211 TaxID=3342752 RepID=UPI0035BA6E75